MGDDLPRCACSLPTHVSFWTLDVYEVECSQEHAPFADSLAPVTSCPLLSGWAFLLCQLLLKETRLSEVFFWLHIYYIFGAEVFSLELEMRHDCLSRLLI